MAITGNLRTMQLSELLQWLSMGQKTGTLVIRGTTGEKSIFFQNGRIISSASTNEREYLGHFLVSYGYITDGELTRAMEVQEESKILLGKILVMIGAISEDDLTELIRLKAAETIYDIFLWKEGAFHFVDDEIPQRPMVPISIDVTGLVMEGLRRYDEWQRIRTRIPTLREVPAIVRPVAVESLGERERLILRHIDGERSLEEIGEATHNTDFHVAKLVFDLLESSHVELQAPKPLPPRSAELTPEDPYEAVFEAAASSPFEGLADVADEITVPPQPAPRRDFSRFLKRGESAEPPSRPRGPVTTSFPPIAPESSSFTRPAGPASGSFARPSPPPSTSFARPTGGPPSTSFIRPPAPPAPPAPFVRPPAQPPARTAAPPSGTYTTTGAFAPAASFVRPAQKPKSDTFPRPPQTPHTPPAAPSSPVSAPPAAAPPLPALSAAAPRASIYPTSVPMLTKPMEELMAWAFTPNEAFIVSRINGIWDVRSIAKISPFPESEVLRVFAKLHDGGLVRWR